MRKILLLIALSGLVLMAGAQTANKNALNQTIDDSIRTNGLNKITAVTLNALLHRLLNGVVDSGQVLNTITGQKGLTNGIPGLSAGLVPLSQLPPFLDTAYATDDTTLTISIHHNFFNIKILGKGGASPDTTSLSARINAKLSLSDTSSMLSAYLRFSAGMKYSDTGNMLVPYLRFSQGVKYTDTAGMLTAYARSAQAVKYADTATMLTPYLRISGFTPAGIGLGNLLNSRQVVNIGGMDSVAVYAHQSGFPSASAGPTMAYAADSNALYFNNRSAYTKISGGAGSGGGAADSSVFVTRTFGTGHYYPLSGNPSGFLTAITGSQVTAALGFAPYSSSNPSGFITANQSITISATGDISGAASGTTAINPSLTVVGLKGVAIPTLATGNLRYNGSAFIWDNTHYLTGSDTASLNGRINTKVNATDTAAMLTPYLRSAVAATTYATITNLALKLDKTDSVTGYTSRGRNRQGLDSLGAVLMARGINHISPVDSLSRVAEVLQIAGNNLVGQTADGSHDGYESTIHFLTTDSIHNRSLKSKILVGHTGNGSWAIFANAAGDSLLNKTDTVSGGLTLTNRADSSRLWGIDLTKIMDLTSTQTASGKTFTSPVINGGSFNGASTTGQIIVATDNAGHWAWGSSASGITGVGSFSSASILNGATVSGPNLILAVADTNNVGLVSTIAQSIKGAKNFISPLAATNTVTFTGLTAGSKTDSAVTQDAAGNLHHKAAFFLDSTSIHQGYVPGWDTASKTFKMQVNGTGSTNSSVGSGVKLVIAGTNNVKSVTFGIGVKIDSLTANQVNFIADTGYLMTQGTTQNISGAKIFAGDIKMPGAVFATPTATTKVVTVDSLSGEVRHIGFMNIDTSAIANGAFVKWDSADKKFVVNSSAGAGTVTVFSANDISGFATQGVATATLTPVLTYTLVPANPHTFWGNFTGSAGSPSYGSPLLASGDFANQGTTTGLLHGNAAGNPSWGPASLVTDVTGLLQAAQFPSLSGDISNTAGSTVMAIGAGKVTNTMLAGSIDLTTKVLNVLPGTNGGNGVNNGSTTETRGGNVTFSGANNVTFTSTGATSITLPTSGILLNTTGNGSSLSGIPISINGTANQVIASAATGAITLSLPQSIGTGNAPTFSGATFNGTVKIADGTQGAGKTLQSDASGNTSWVTTIPTGGLSSNVYTPTVTNVLNAAGITVKQSFWVRVGNIITVDGAVALNVPPSETMSVSISLPVASSFTSSNDVRGTALSLPDANNTGTISGNTSTGLAILNMNTSLSGFANNGDYFFHFVYIVK